MINDAYNLYFLSILARHADVKFKNRCFLLVSQLSFSISVDQRFPRTSERKHQFFTCKTKGWKHKHRHAKIEFMRRKDKNRDLSSRILDFDYRLSVWMAQGGKQIEDMKQRTDRTGVSTRAITLATRVTPWKKRKSTLILLACLSELASLYVYLSDLIIILSWLTIFALMARGLWSGSLSRYLSFFFRQRGQ